MSKYIYLNVCNAFLTIWQHIKTPPWHNVSVRVLLTWSRRSGPTENNHVFKHTLNHESLDSHYKT